MRKILLFTLMLAAMPMAWADQYAPSGIQNGADNLYVEYAHESDAGGWGSTDYFAMAKYRFPSSMDRQRVVRVRDMVVSKYGFANY